MRRIIEYLLQSFRGQQHLAIGIEISDRPRVLAHMTGERDQPFKLRQRIIVWRQDGLLAREIVTDSHAYESQVLRGQLRCVRPAMSVLNGPRQAACR